MQRELERAKREIAHLKDQINELQDEKDALLAGSPPQENRLTEHHLEVNETLEGQVTELRESLKVAELRVMNSEQRHKEEKARRQEMDKALLEAQLEHREQMDRMKERVAQLELCDQKLQEEKKLSMKAGQALAEMHEEHREQIRALEESRESIVQKAGHAMGVEKDRELAKANSAAASKSEELANAKQRYQGELGSMRDQLEAFKAQSQREKKQVNNLQARLNAERDRADREVERHLGLVKMNRRLMSRAKVAENTASVAVRQKGGAQLQLAKELQGGRQHSGVIGLIHSIGRKECAMPGLSAPQASAEAHILKLKAQVHAEAYARHTAEEMVTRLMDKLNDRAQRRQSVDSGDDSRSVPSRASSRGASFASHISSPGPSYQFPEYQESRAIESRTTHHPNRNANEDPLGSGTELPVPAHPYSNSAMGSYCSEGGSVVEEAVCVPSVELSAQDESDVQRRRTSSGDGVDHFFGESWGDQLDSDSDE